MDPITTNTLNKNNVMTTRYFNNGTVYADFLKTSDNHLIDVKNLSSEIELEEIRADVQNISTELADLRTNLTDLRGDVELMSIDIQSDLFTPLYSSSDDITRMSSLTSYINNHSTSIYENVVPKMKKFDGLVDITITDVVGGSTEYDMKLRDMVYCSVGNIPLSESLLDTTICKVYLQKFTGAIPFNRNAYTFDLAMKFDSTFSTNYSSKLSVIYFPNRIYNKKDGKWYSFSKSRASLSTCDLSRVTDVRLLFLHFKKINIGLANSNYLFYQLFDPATTGIVVLIIHDITTYKTALANYSIPVDNYKYFHIYMRYSPTLLKLCDLYANMIYLIPHQEGYINWDSCSTSYIPTHKSPVTTNNSANNPCHYVTGTSTNWYSTLIIESMNTSFTTVMDTDDN